MSAISSASLLLTEDHPLHRVQRIAIGVGGEAQWFIDSARTTSIMLSLFYAPDIITFGQADNVQDTTLRFMTKLRNGFDIFLGYRNFRIDIQPQDREVDDNLHLGFRRSF